MLPMTPDPELLWTPCPTMWQRLWLLHIGAYPNLAWAAASCGRPRATSNILMLASCRRWGRPQPQDRCITVAESMSVPASSRRSADLAICALSVGQDCSRVGGSPSGGLRSHGSGKRDCGYTTLSSVDPTGLVCARLGCCIREVEGQGAAYAYPRAYWAHRLHEETNAVTAPNHNYELHLGDHHGREHREPDSRAHLDPNRPRESPVRGRPQGSAWAAGERAGAPARWQARYPARLLQGLLLT